MNKTRIEWCDYSINPVKGLCPMDCRDNEGKEYCYARRLYKRFKWNPEIRLIPLLDVQVKEGSRIFVGSTMELFGNWIKSEWLEYILKWVNCHPNHTFIFLTKKPENLIKFSPFPKNCWVGATVTDSDSYRWAMAFLSQISARIKFLSIEPLLNQFWLRNWEYQKPLKATLNWVILGQQTPVRKNTMPKVEWIQEITVICDNEGIPVFQKNNLKPLLGKNLRQDFPK